MTSPEMYDTIVVGAGIEGSATAYQLVKQGVHTLLLEQFPLPHSRGSSHGQSRITRKAYGAKTFYTEMMKEAYPLLEQLEKEAGEQLFINTGVPSNQFLRDSVKGITQFNLPHERFTSDEVKARFPSLNYPDTYEFVLDKSGGVLRADKTLQAFQKQYKARGGHLKDGEALVTITPGKVITIETTKSVYRCKSLVLTVGPWAPAVLEKIGLRPPLQPLRTSVCYWTEQQVGQHSSSVFPVIIARQVSGEKYGIYGLPVEEYPGMMKLCVHHGPKIHPDNRDKVGDDWAVTRASQYVARHFPTLESTPCIVEPCIYTVTPDKNFILDTHPQWTNIVIGAGFSGHGFKLAPVVGKMLAELATGKKPSYDLSPFCLARFTKGKL